MCIGGSKKFFACRDLTLLEFDGFGTQHGVGKIQIPFMRWHIRTFRQITKVTQIALVDDFPKVFLVDAVQLAGAAFVNQIKQGGE